MLKGNYPITTLGGQREEGVVVRTMYWLEGDGVTSRRGVRGEQNRRGETRPERKEKVVGSKRQP